jgi:sugar-specific transcriptional regulator TrmB
MTREGPVGTELIDHLAGIGIEEREAKLFLHLSLHGPKRASDAAAATRLKRTETYRALESLMKRGFVTAQLTRPVVYEALAPEVLFTELLTGHEQRRSDIERIREHVITAVSAARREQAAPGGRPSYKIIQGRRPIYGSIETATRNARDSIDIASTQMGVHSAAAKNRAWLTLVRRASEGLRIRLLIRDQPGIERALEPLRVHANVEVRFLTLDHPLRFLLADEREVVCWLVNDTSLAFDAAEDVAMWTNAPDFLQAQRSFFAALWNDARGATKPLD